MAGIGSTPALIVGTAVGGAAAAAFEPALEVPRQEAWQSAPNRLPDVGLIAELVAGGKVTLADGRAMAKRLGFDQGPFDSLTWLSQNRLDFPAMLRMWRLSAVNPDFDEAGLSALVNETLAHDRLDWQYQPYLRALKHAELPGIGDIAYAVVRGYLPTNIPLPVAPPSTSTKVKRFPQANVLAEDLAAALGYSAEMLELFIARSGLSMAPGLAAVARFRDILADDDYHLAISEGDLRTEWADALLEASRIIPTAGEFMENALRGWRTKAEGETGAALHGMTQAHADVLYQNKRRPLSVPNITKALARGGTFDTSAAPMPDPYDAAVHEADLGPEWYDLAKHLKYSYPSAFVLRALAQAGELGDAAAVEQILLEIGWKPDLATKVAKSWTGGGAVADPHVAKAQTQLWSTLHRSYLAGETDVATAQTTLGTAGVAAGAVSEVLSIWDAEQALVRKQLTPAQLKKAYKAGDVNPATNAAWTLDEALARLIAMGYSTNDATTFLEE